MVWLLIAGVIAISARHFIRAHQTRKDLEEKDRRVVEEKARRRSREREAAFLLERTQSLSAGEIIEVEKDGHRRFALVLSRNFDLGKNDYIELAYLNREMTKWNRSESAVIPRSCAWRLVDRDERKSLPLPSSVEWKSLLPAKNAKFWVYFRPARGNEAIIHKAECGFVNPGGEVGWRVYDAIGDAAKDANERRVNMRYCRHCF